MWIQVGNARARVERADASERQWLAEFLTFDDARTHFSGTTNRLLDPLSGTFPAGLLPRVAKEARAAGLTVELFDARPFAAPRDREADLSFLRDYQRAGVEAVVERERGILHHPTGSGKSATTVGITLALPARWLFLVHRTQIALQQAAAFERWAPGVAVGTFLEGTLRWKPEDPRGLVVATFQTMLSEAGAGRADRVLNWATGLLVDECHVAPADSYHRLLMRTENARLRVGMSGTPMARGDRRSVLAVGTLGPVIHRVRFEELAARGLLARPTIRLVEHAEECDRPTWQGVYGEAISGSASRNRLVVSETARIAGPRLVFVRELRHGRNLERALLRAGVRAEFVRGDTPIEIRRAKVRDLAAGRLDVVVATVVFQEGIDVPELSGIVVASGGKSVIAAIQRIGRGTRPGADGAKRIVEVSDVFDTGCPDPACRHAGCKWLRRHSRERERAYAGEGYEVTRVKGAVAAVPRAGVSPTSE